MQDVYVRVPRESAWHYHQRDDFVMEGHVKGSAWLVEVVRKVFIVKDRKVLGSDTGDMKDMTCFFHMLLPRGDLSAKPTSAK